MTFVSPPSTAQSWGYWSAETDRAVELYRDEIVALRRHLHAHPEPSGEEYKTSLYLYQKLSDCGFAVQMGPEGRGLVVDVPGPAAPTCMAIRADIDALRIHDRKKAEYRSRHQGIMHACGHDAHTAVVYGALRAVKQVASHVDFPWSLALRGIFQPAEETAKGAYDMIAAGALEGVDAILAIHVDPTRAVGTVAVRAGVLTANCDVMEITIRGRGGHAARPHESNDPIAAAAHMTSTLYQFVPRLTDSQDAVVVTIGQINGGDNPNVIPEEVRLFGTVRTLDSDVRRRTIKHIQQVANAIAQLSGTTIDVVFRAGSDSVRNDVRLTELVGQATEGLPGPIELETIPRASMGSEDFAAYLEHVSGSMFRLGCARGPLPSPGLHTSLFDVDERVLTLGAKLLARTVLLWSASREQGNTSL